ncbi:hypothetical protein F7231_17500 [Fibrella aestuarina]|uniref:DUF1206 domain-containing protein n=1 Tax=Fibrivirga algicola TaxID=2950420 RepID=A0ABX0QIL3_9BACT|nr:hypothetical protein A6C57_09085 [Fibrella sp. ES10-3-2-2]NID11971.1 hypothetical protein [Fibrivirga algicola]
MNRDNNRLAENLRFYLSVLASVAYLGGGIALIASSQSFGMADSESPLSRIVAFIIADGPLRYALAVLLIIYGGYRGYRAIQQFRNR